ncbi:hypothetical protein [Streptomyces benahoarensis]|uniref:Uncharacterized protein n=1 Tax=Streptomyces benahoarensis TaxID=2595054 RepID=A0A553ZIN3_9ACTN|nr:hypothetical protein [Streptomyces benahoarensis]TSB31891.1 hypothetical protein FNJ62_04315 [Streptomyces benahoarensis]TSB41321.1 hypothetical protein FNZ23_12670 [Streptomyces benahoarensis]
MFARVRAVVSRATAGRAATVAGAAVLTVGLATDSVTAPGVLAAVTTAGIGLATNIKIFKGPVSARDTAIGVYVAPHVGACVLLVAERLAPDTGVSLLVQAGVVALWTGATWVMRPGRLARDLVDEAVAQELAEFAAAAEAALEETEEAPSVTYDTPQARWWGENIAVEGGVAPGTVLVEHRQVTEQCLALVIGAEKRGTPVPEISATALSAYLDMPEDLIEIGPVPGRGAGVRLLVLGVRPQPAEPEQADDDAALWEEIADTAMPGVELIEATTYTVRKELT